MSGVRPEGSDEPRLWLADPSVAWTVALVADLERAPDRGAVGTRLRDLNRRLASGTPGDLVEGRDGDDLLDAVTRASSAPLTAGLAGQRLAVAGDHQFSDGLALLAVLGELTGTQVSSTARGVAGRPSPPFRREVLGRVREVAVAPPARVAASAARGRSRVDGSVFADRLLDRQVGVAALVHAAAQGVVAFNRARGVRARRVAVAVGASERSGDSPELGDHSALLRLRRAEQCTEADVREFLRSAPTVPSPGRSLEGSPGWLTRAAALGVRVVGPRLGSTVVVSHLGEVTSPGARLRFYPVSGGASGVSVGAVTQQGRTWLTARARRRDHDEAGLADLLERLVDHLGPSAPD